MYAKVSFQLTYDGGIGPETWSIILVKSFFETAWMISLTKESLWLLKYCSLIYS